MNYYSNDFIQVAYYFNLFYATYQTIERASFLLEGIDDIEECLPLSALVGSSLDLDPRDVT